ASSTRRRTDHVPEAQGAARPSAAERGKGAARALPCWRNEAMKLCVVGTGYVGLVAGTCFAESGNDVTCVDVIEEKIAALKRSEIPIYEPGLEELVRRNIAEKPLNFTTDLADSVKSSEICIIAVGTPMGHSRAADLSAVMAVAEAIAKAMDGYRVVAIKSTVPIGTADRVRRTIASLT